MKSKLSCALSVVGALLMTSGAGAQESTNRVAANTDWSVFVESDPTECWSVSAPKESVNSRNGSVVSANRGDNPPMLMVLYRPSSSIQGQVSFRGGNYNLAGGATVTLDIGDAKFQFFTEGEWAWPATPEDDARIVAAMKRGSQAKVTSLSGRGTQSVDTFSLSGFTAAVEEAASRCAG
jgi:hypothetical protein